MDDPDFEKDPNPAASPASCAIKPIQKTKSSINPSTASIVSDPDQDRTEVKHQLQHPQAIIIAFINSDNNESEFTSLPDLRHSEEYFNQVRMSSSGETTSEWT